MDVISIDIESDFGAFTKPYSTTGGLLTFKAPTKTAIVGIMGAISGLSFEEANKHLSDLKVGLKPLNGIKTKTITYNSHYGGRKGRWVNIRQEILINPEYRIYLDFSEVTTDEKQVSDIKNILSKNNLNNQINSFTEGLIELLKNNINYYTPYMGKNNFPLRYRSVETNLVSINDIDTKIECDCIVPKEALCDFEVKEKSATDEGELSLGLEEPNSLKFHIIRNFPVSQRKNRDFSEYRDMILKEIGDRVKLEVEPKSLNGEFKLFKDAQGKLVPLF